MDMTAMLLQQLLLWGLLPLWLLAGFGDWLCHRVQRIEHNAGPYESMLHWLMLLEMGPALAAALLLDISAGVLALMFVLVLAHELTTWWDLSYAAARRRIPPVEQWMHALQLSLPWAALVSLALIHHDQAAALLGRGTPDWGFYWKEPPLPPAYLWGVLAAGVLLVGLPFVEEHLRCRRAAIGAARRRAHLREVVRAAR
ncbi:diguanylate cyclase [Azohydromonas caseinilytica]|uniref:diguanylate cyclase n=1 Tax=Azohydromonas caseinilytica TaxID=2728836 RepID=UPI00197B597F|nr:diguanylate cyclase [Azohydromonas caseinilytica]